MADLTDKQASQSIKITGADPSTGVETNYLDVDVSGNVKTVVNNASGASAVNIQDGGNSITIDATSLPLPTGASTLAEQQTQTTSLQLLDDSVNAINTALNKAIAVAGQFDDAATTVATENNIAPVRITAQRGMHSNLRDSSGTELLGQKAMAASIPVTFSSDQTPLTVAITSNTNTFLYFGDITTSALTQVFIQRTTYTEQTTDAQRSLVSASANDAAAGTGARTVILTYFNSTGAGPFTETVTLNGVTPVNTVGTNICFVDSIEVVTVGSGGVNAGIISLKAATGGGGATIGTIGATDNITYWTHKYIPTGVTAYLTGASVSHSGTTVGSGGVFVIKAKSLSANAVEAQVGDFLRLYGQSSTVTRVYQSALKVVGPARLRTYVTPETSSSTVYRASVDLNLI